MPDRREPPGLTVLTDEMIKPGRALWKNSRGDGFCYTRFLPWPGQTEAREHPPVGTAHSVVVHPDDYERFLDMVGTGDIRY